jgi:hypothetical protein
MTKRFFVTVIAPDNPTLIRLQEFDFDLFRPTARVNERKEFTIEGLLTLEQIGRLVEAGYRVVVEDESSKRERAKSGGIELEAWMKGMEE